MKRVVTILLVFGSVVAHGQTTIQPCTPISTVSGLPFGTYKYISGLDTVTLTIATAIPVCPVCKVYTHADTLAIQALKVCPAPPLPRTVISITQTYITGKLTTIITFSDGVTQIL